jgi:hypothetical protein
MGIVRCRRTNPADVVASSDDGKLRHAAAVRRMYCGLGRDVATAASYVAFFFSFLFYRGKKGTGADFDVFGVTLSCWGYDRPMERYRTTASRIPSMEGFLDPRCDLI